MKSEELNHMLREMVKSLIDQGWSKTKISKIILGSNGQSQMNAFLSDNEKQSDFGVKPLSRIADLLDTNLYVVFANSETEKELINYINETNINFINNLNNSIQNYLSSETKPLNFDKSTSVRVKQVIDQLFDE